jgi:LEA14-like dessication related protein
MGIVPVDVIVFAETARLVRGTLGVPKIRPARYDVRMRPTFHAAPVLVICFLAVGCARLNVQRPTASVTGMSVGEVNPEGFILNFAADVANPNGFALPLHAADYTLGVGGAELLRGEANPARSIPANGSLAVTLPVQVTFERLLAVEQAIRDSGGNVPYDFQAGLSFDTGTPLAGKLRVPVRHSGTLPLRRVLSDPEALLRSPAAKRLAASVLGHFLGR